MLTATRIFLLTMTAFVVVACSRPDYQTQAGGSGNFGDGKWLLVNYWATWCGPCREEIPALNTIHQDLDAVTVLGVNYDNLEGAALSVAITEMAIRFPSLLEDPSAKLMTDRPTVLPTTLVVSPDGKLVQQLQGPQTEAELRQLLQSYQGS